MAALLIQYLFLVGFGPSSKTWPKWAPQLAQVTSFLIIPGFAIINSRFAPTNFFYVLSISSASKKKKKSKERKFRLCVCVQAYFAANMRRVTLHQELQKRIRIWLVYIYIYIYVYGVHIFWVNWWSCMKWKKKEKNKSEFRRIPVRIDNQVRSFLPQLPMLRYIKGYWSLQIEEYVNLIATEQQKGERKLWVSICLKMDNKIIAWIWNLPTPRDVLECHIRNIKINLQKKSAKYRLNVKEVE